MKRTQITEPVQGESQGGPGLQLAWDRLDE